MKSSKTEETSLFSEFSPPTREAWREVAVASLKGAPYEKRVITKTLEDIDLQPIYWADDLEGLGHIGGRPGDAPYVRGRDPEGYLGAPWAVCQEISTSLPEDFNAAARNDLERGQTALGITLDELTRQGRDVDAPDVVDGDVGRSGISLCCLADFEAALLDIDLASIPLHIVTGCSSIPVLSQVIALTTKREGSTGDLRGLIGADPLGELSSMGELPIALETAYDHMASTVAWARSHSPQLQTIAIRSCPYHDGGANAVQELAAIIATAAEYIRALMGRGEAIHDITAQIRFTLSLGSRFFIEVAKIRAARLLFSQLAKGFGGNEAAQKTIIHGRTSARNMTVYDPYVNMLRNTTEAYSGLIGGVDSLHVRPFDEPHRRADEFSRRVSRNIQLLLQHEAHASTPIDPSGGSYFVEVLTDQLGRAAWALFQEIEGRGGMAKVLDEGWFQEQIFDVETRHATHLEKRRSVLIGTNTYANMTERPLEVPAIDVKARKKGRVETLRKFRRSTPSETAREEARSSLSETEVGAALVEMAIEAVTAGCTLGDISSALGENNGPTIKRIAASRSAEPYEQLRNNASYWAAHKGGSLKVFLANLGPLPQHKARADFSRAFFEIGGFEIISNEGFTSPEEAANAAVASGAPIVCICSTDATYPEAVPPLARLVKTERPETSVILAGRPAKDHESSYREAGMDQAIFIGSNCYDLLKTLQVQNGVTDERPNE